MYSVYFCVYFLTAKRVCVSFFRKEESFFGITSVIGKKKHVSIETKDESCFCACFMSVITQLVLLSSCVSASLFLSKMQRECSSAEQATHIHSLIGRTGDSHTISSAEQATHIHSLIGQCSWREEQNNCIRDHLRLKKSI